MIAQCQCMVGLDEPCIDRSVLQLPSRNIEVELTTVSSNYHVELNPSDVGYQDRYVVQEIIKV